MKKRWPLARDDCANRGGHLVTIRNSDENGKIYYLTQGYHSVLGGLYRCNWNCGHGWCNITGEPYTFSYWAGGQPDC